MKTKQTKLKRKPIEKPVHLVEGKAIVTALHKAMIPSRFVRKEVKLDAFAWGGRMREWIDSILPEATKAGFSLIVAGTADDAMSSCAMLTRTLVMRGHDAVFITLAEMINAPPPRSCEYLVISGFYDAGFNKSKGKPMSAEECFRLSWMLWRMANNGTTLIVQCSPSFGGVSEWWHLGALNSLFRQQDTLHL